MKLFKKIAAVIVFLSLITAFVLFRMGYFESYSQDRNGQYIVTNEILESDRYIEGEKRLIIDHELMLVVDTIASTAFRTVKKKFILEDFSSRIIPSSKSIVLGTELPNFATKNKKILQQLRNHNIVRVNFTSNRGLKSSKSDASLLEALELLENNELKVGSRMERFMFEEKSINLHWTVTNKIVTIEFTNNGPQLLANRSDVDDFLKWYETFEKREEMTSVISSSKSVVTNDEATKRWIETNRKNRSLFSNKLREYLNIKF